MTISIVLSCPHEFHDIAREQFSNAGLPVVDRKAIMVNTMRTPVEDWGERELDYFDSSIRKALVEFKEGDIVYLDCEVPGYNHKREINLRVLTVYEDLISDIRTKFPAGTLIGVYGLPYNRHWPPYSTAPAVQGMYKLVTSAHLDWLGINTYANYQSSVYHIPMTKEPGEFKDRLTLALSLARGTEAKGIPFYQPVLRGSEQTDHQPLQRRTVKDWWSTMYCSGVDTIVWWYEPGTHGEYVERNNQLIQQQAEWINKTIGDLELGEE